MKSMLKLFGTVVLLGAAAAWAGDEELCLDCHEPAEDWDGMTAEEVYSNASDTSIKRHIENADFSEEQLRAIVATLLQPE